MLRIKAMPPAIGSLSLEKSSLAKSGSSRKEENKVLTPVIPENFSFLRIIITRLVSRGLATRMLRPPRAMKIRPFTVSEKM